MAMVLGLRSAPDVLLWRSIVRENLSMEQDEFSWYPMSAGLTSGGMVLRRGGPHGTVYASVCEQDSVWVAFLDLHRPKSTLRSAIFETEVEAIDAVEQWLEQLIASGSVDR